MTGGIEHLDFGVRNTLLYYKDLKATLDLTPGAGANPGAVGRLLGSERVSVSELFDSGVDALRTATKRVRSISYRARRDVDKGSPGTLCVAWGLATWDNGRPAVPAAPVVLRQASVGRHVGTAEDFDLGVSGPWIVNTTLLRLLEVDFGADVERDALADLVEELVEHGDPEALFERVAKMASEVPGFSIAPRVVLAPIPRVAMVAGRHATAVMDRAVPPVADAPAVMEAPAVIEEPTGVEVSAAPDTPTMAEYPDESGVAPMTDAALADESTLDESALDADPADDGLEEWAGARVELLRGGEPGEESLFGEPGGNGPVEEFGPDRIVAEITTALRGDNWPEPLIEHADSGLRVRNAGELVQRWYDAQDERPRPSRWDATHFALWGLTAAPPVGDPAILSVDQWAERRQHPVLVAWQKVAEHRYRRHRRDRRMRVKLPSKRTGIPRGIDEALWGLPVDLLVEWAAWVFRQWPGAPIELVLPVGTPELVGAWYERARPVAELAVKTWVPFSALDDDLGKAAGRWVKHLSTACDGGGAPLATWFEKSMEAATAVVAVRVGAGGGPGPHRGRRGKRGSTVTHAEHAI